MNRQKTLMVMAGGTGGHVMPALAVANVMRDRGYQVIWMGSESGIEQRLVPAAGFQLLSIAVKGIRGTGIKRKLMMPWMLMSAAWQTFTMLTSSKADVLLGMGGFASGPGGVIGWLLRKPMVIHEQNAKAGLTNQLLSRFATRVLSGFESVAGLAAAQWVGNPVKAEIVASTAPEERFAGRDESSINLLVVGGSQGAAVFNEHCPQLLARADLGAQLNVWHQTGRDKAAAVEAGYRKHDVQAKVNEFIDDMASAYQWADVVLARAGAMTIAEIAAVGVAAILVPYPFAAGDHQTENARVLVEAGAAFCLSQTDFEADAAIPLLKKVVAQRELLIEMACSARQLSKPNAASSVADVCEELMLAGGAYA